MMFGFIGYGNMGSAVLRALLKDGSIGPDQVIVHNRSAERLEPLLRAYPEVKVAESPSEVAATADVVILCVKSGAVPSLMADIAPSLLSRTHLVTINGGVQIANLEKRFSGAISKIIPSMTLEVGRGVTLVCHNDRVSKDQKDGLSRLFGRSSLVRELREEQLEAATDLTSCAPGLMAEMMVKFAEGGAEAGHLSREAALEMVLETMMGTATLLTDHGVAPEDLKSRVATKGGITEQGLKVLDRELPQVFDQVFRATLGKQVEVKKAITVEFDRGC